MEATSKGVRYLYVGGFMVKAKDFLEYLCNNLKYRMFAGVPCKGLDNLYNEMNSDFMHYIPAVNEQIAVGIVNGAFLAGTNSAVFMDADKIIKLDLDFNVFNSIPILIIASSNDRPNFIRDVYSSDLTDDLISCLKRVTKHIITKGKPGVLFIKEGMLQ